jgi:protein-S-isoprenylcysteine O-methyltransferase Ste14
MTEDRNLPGLLFWNLIFTILQPGIVVLLIPWLILGSRVRDVLNSEFQHYQYLGIVAFITGLVIMGDCILRFAIQGKGTLSPADPTRKLVIKGLYRYSRNPMYIGVLLMITGEAIIFDSTSLWIYLGIVFAAFNVFILFVEEPRLKRDFGEEYEIYRGSVRRWV